MSQSVSASTTASSHIDLNNCFDVVVVGAGVVGCAMARRFTLQGARVLVLEKGSDLLSGASKGNSAILHTGFDAEPGSLEQACIRSGYEEYIQISHDLGLPVLRTAALVVAWNQAEVDQLEPIVEKASANEVNKVCILSAVELASKEPLLADNAKAAVEVAGESIVDPWTTPFVYLLQAIENGASVLRNAEVLSGRFDGEQWQLNTTQGHVKSNLVINCSGLFGDQIDETLLGQSSFKIRPRKGQFLVFDKSANSLVNSIILPVPGDITKGVVVCKTIFGNLLVGPTAEEQQSRDDASVDTINLRALFKKGLEIIPQLANHTVTATYAGLRPASEFKDYQIQAYEQQSYISVGGIRSTGLSAALGIARHVYGLYEKMERRHEALSEVIYTQVNPIAEHLDRDWCKTGNGGVVCHCELVTRREIEQALIGPLAAKSLSALKRRTRVTMGRCQGFYCSAELSEMTAGCFQDSMSVDDVES